MTDEQKPAAWLHTVRVLNGDPNETDEALSFAADNFPLGGTGLFEGVSSRPLYDQAVIYAAIAAERDRCAQIVQANADASSGMLREVLQSNADAIRRGT
jgi:hypothetical protein